MQAGWGQTVTSTKKVALSFPLSSGRPLLGLGLLSGERSKMENHKKVNCLCPDRQLLLKAYGPACRTNLGCPQVLHHHDTPTQGVLTSHSKAEEENCPGCRKGHRCEQLCLLFWGREHHKDQLPCPALLTNAGCGGGVETSSSRTHHVP